VAVTRLVRVIDHFDEVIGFGNAMTAQAQDDAAEEIVQLAKSFSRVRTSQMRDGWKWEKQGTLVRRVYNDVPWTIFNELGTIYMSAQPMLHPAEEIVQPQYVAAVAAAWGGRGLVLST